MKRNTGFWVIVFVLVFGASEGFAQQQRLDAATKILIPSSARTASFNSFLAVINLDSQDNAITITARRDRWKCHWNSANRSFFHPAGGFGAPTSWAKWEELWASLDPLRWNQPMAGF